MRRPAISTAFVCLMILPMHWTSFTIFCRSSIICVQIKCLPPAFFPVNIYRALVWISASFRILCHISFHLINARVSRVFFRNLRQEDAAAEIAVSRSSSGHGWVASREIRGKFGESVSILRHRHSLTSYLKYLLHLQCVKGQWPSNLRADSEHGMW